jgi:hypothetical protein
VDPPPLTRAWNRLANLQITLQKIGVGGVTHPPNTSNKNNPRPDTKHNYTASEKEKRLKEIDKCARIHSTKCSQY